MVNLVSPAQKKKLLRLYLLRVTAVAFFALAAVGVSVLVVLTPSYLVIHADADQAEEYVQTATELASQRAKGQSPETLARFHEAVSLLTKTARPPSYAHILDLTTQDRPLGVTLSSLSVVYEDSGAARVTLAGTARTRAELIAYANSLKKVPELSQVVVPVSALVADVQADFTISLRWAREKKS